MKKVFEYLLSIPKSLFFCFRVLPFYQAVRIPIVIRYNVVIRNVGHISIKGPLEFGQCRLGFGTIGIIDKSKERTIWDVAGSVCFAGRVSIGPGSRIVVSNEGVLTFGDSFINTARICVICYKKISFGYQVLISWDALIMDTDFHYIGMCDKMDNLIREKEIFIGNHVWIGCRTTILKGTFVPENSVVASNAVVTKKFMEKSILLAGNPAQIVKREIEWKFNL